MLHPIRHRIRKATSVFGLHEESVECCSKSRSAARPRMTARLDGRWAAAEDKPGGQA
jgi:hypothetical protein